jgi:RNA polymerase sigma-70 factor (ECF subfamily)
MDPHEAQFTEAFEAYGDELFRHAMMRLSDRERALEVTQECFLRTFEYVRKGGKIEQMRPFLYRTLRNLIIDEYRRHKSVSLESIAESHEMDVELLLPGDESNTLAAAVGRFEGARALAALQELPDVYREALTLRYVEELSPREIAAIVGESENVVSVRVHRALKKLRELLEGEQENHDG